MPPEKDKQIISGEILLDKVSDYHHSRSRFKMEPKPGRMFKKFHKPRRKPSKEELGRKAVNYMRWKEISDAINTEEATPLDE